MAEVSLIAVAEIGGELRKRVVGVLRERHEALLKAPHAPKALWRQAELPRQQAPQMAIGNIRHLNAPGFIPLGWLLHEGFDHRLSVAGPCKRFKLDAELVQKQVRIAASDLRTPSTGQRQAVQGVHATIPAARTNAQQPTDSPGLQPRADQAEIRIHDGRQWLAQAERSDRREAARAVEKDIGTAICDNGIQLRIAAGFDEVEPIDERAQLGRRPPLLVVTDCAAAEQTGLEAVGVEARHERGTGRNHRVSPLMNPEKAARGECAPQFDRLRTITYARLTARVPPESPMKRVTGIGGIFFQARDPAALRAWYRRHLGIDVQDWGGTAFSWADEAGNAVKGTTVWSIGAVGNEYYAPSAAPFMINYRVENLPALLQALREEGCTVLEKMDDSEFGKFGWVIDPEGNKVELWEPPAGQ